MQTFWEGGMHEEAKRRYREITVELADGYLERQILLCRSSLASLDLSSLTQQHKQELDKLVTSVTSEVGRALVSLIILQLCVKEIEPTQSITESLAQQRREIAPIDEPCYQWLSTLREIL